MKKYVLLMTLLTLVACSFKSEPVPVRHQASEDKPSFEIKFYNRYTGQLESEKVYGNEWLYWLYTTKSGNLLLEMVTKKFVSKAYGKLQDAPFTKKKIKGFIQDYDIDMTQFKNGSLGTEVAKEDSYSCFNDFFIREFVDGARPLYQGENILTAFSEARYLAFEKVTKDQKFPVKGSELSAEALLANKKWEKLFMGGPLMIARLAPVDYHRFHYPTEGKVIDSYPVHGDYYSVNPIALEHKDNVYSANERRVSILETKEFGKIAYIEVGATMVGKIIQTHDISKPFKKGEQKGHFLFGASTVIIIGEPGKWLPDQDLLEHSQNKIETLIRLGDRVGEKI